MTGIRGNRTAPPVSGPPGTRGSGQLTRHPNGRVETYRGPNNTEARFHPDGRVRVVRANGMMITRSSAGVRTTVVERPGDRVIVTHGAGRGYVQRPFTVRNQTFVQRTYHVNNVARVRVYRPYAYRGGTLHAYAPAGYYSPVFYGWAHSRWRAPVYYSWGWAGSPWFGYYGGYFAPYPVYSSASLWLTDYLVAATLQEAYQERMAAAAAAQANVSFTNSASSGQTALTPDVKQAIANEVQWQLQMERAEAQNSLPASASNGLPLVLGDKKPHVFLVARSLDVINLTAGGQECAITEGDVLRLNRAPPQNADAANVMVIASKGQDCRTGSLVAVSLEDLMEMQNHMRETIDQGLEELRSKQGQGGLPALPAAASRAPVQAAFAAELPPPDQNVADELRRQAQQANQAEQEVVSQASAPGASAGPATVSLGQTADQVAAILGAPTKVVDLGAKKIFVYKDMKIIFSDGRVSDVQ